MKKEIWRYIKGTFHKNQYQVSNRGKIKTKKRKYITQEKILCQAIICDRFYVSIQKTNGIYSYKSVANLVLSHFKKHEIDKNYALHINYNTLDNNSTNLKWATLGDIRRISFEKKKKSRGVYKYKHAKKKQWRAVLKIDNKTITIGYYKTKTQAQIAYRMKYFETYNRMPY